MSEASPNPAPAPKPKGKGLKKAGAAGVLVIGVAALLHFMGITDFGVGEGNKEGSEKTSPVVNEEDPNESGEGESSSPVQDANLVLRLGGTGIKFRIAPMKGDSQLLDVASFDAALTQLRGLFEGYDIRQFDVEIGIDFTEKSKEEVMQSVNEALKDIPTAAKITPNQIDVK